MLRQSGDERFGVEDLHALSELVSETWTSAADRDWSGPAGTLEWLCIRTADHAVDCVYAPAFFLASRRASALWSSVAPRYWWLGPRTSCLAEHSS